jgi:hypothetical protein
MGGRHHGGPTDHQRRGDKREGEAGDHHEQGLQAEAADRRRPRERARIADRFPGEKRGRPAPSRRRWLSSFAAGELRSLTSARLRNVCRHRFGGAVGGRRRWKSQRAGQGLCGVKETEWPQVDPCPQRRPNGRRARPAGAPAVGMKVCGGEQVESRRVAGREARDGRRPHARRRQTRVARTVQPEPFAGLGDDDLQPLFADPSALQCHYTPGSADGRC